MDTCYNNHMYESKSFFSYLDENFYFTVSFGDCSTMNLIGNNDINIKTKNGFIEIIFNVFYVLDLKTICWTIWRQQIILVDGKRDREHRQDKLEGERSQEKEIMMAIGKEMRSLEREEKTLGGMMSLQTSTGGNC